jgi:hypothetical protein
MKSNATRVKMASLFMSAIAALGFAAQSASAADFGVGVLFWGEDRTLLFPIRMGSLIVEPEIFYTRSKQDSTTTPPGTTSTFTSDQYGVATGIYARRDLGPLFETYFGGRLGVSKGKLEQSTPTTTITQDVDSWFVAPTAGLQHFFSKQFSIALDVGLVYERSDQKTSQPTTEQSGKATELDTRTRVILRGYF